MKTLSVMSAESRMMPALHLDNVRRFIGRKPVQNADGLTEWQPTNESVEVPAIGEYILAIKHGDLIAANKETADFCGVKFEG